MGVKGVGRKTGSEGRGKWGLGGVLWHSRGESERRRTQRGKTFNCLKRYFEIHVDYWFS